MNNQNRSPAKRMCCGLLGLLFTLACLPGRALAADGTVTGEGTLESPRVTVTQTVTTDQTGNTTTTTHTVIEAAGTTPSGEELAYTETEQTSTVTDSSGKEREASGWEEGRETVTGEKTENIPALRVDFEKPEPGQTDTDTEEASQPQVSGDLKTGEDDPKYDQTTITETPRELTGTLTDVEITVGDGNVEVGEEIEMGLHSLNPSWPEAGMDLNVWEAEYTPDTTQPEGYDFYYSGYTADSVYGVKYTIDGEDGYADVVQFSLTDPETGEVHTAYCLDMSTGTKNGWWYSVENLEDADYFTDEEADHLRAIVLNGYWGTAEGTGSLNQMKQTLKDALAADPNALDGLTEADVEALTGGEAQTATQMAIWAYGNRVEGELGLTASNYNGSGSNGSCDENPTEEELAAWKKINKISTYLASLTDDGTGTTEVLGQEKFIDSVSLVVGEKVENHENNLDVDDTNDAYHADLCFALAVTVSENDDLVVKVINDNGEVVRTVRLAGDDSQTGYGFLMPDDDGSYTIRDLTLIEGDAAFNITLEGAQYLEEGVYIYSSEARGQQSSQTFVGIAEGYQTVDLSMEVKLNFQVEEGTVTTERIWREEWYQDLSDPEEETKPTATTETTEATESTENTVSEETVQQEGPKTGDGSHIGSWMGMMTLSGGAMLLLALSALRKKKW